MSKKCSNKKCCFLKGHLDTITRTFHIVFSTAYISGFVFIYFFFIQPQKLPLLQHQATHQIRLIDQRVRRKNFTPNPDRSKKKIVLTVLFVDRMRHRQLKDLWLMLCCCKLQVVCKRLSIWIITMTEISKDNLAEVGFEPTTSRFQAQCSTI